MGTIRSKALFLINRAANAYAAGPELSGAKAVCQRLSTEGLNSTICYWNGQSDLPNHVADSYIEVLNEIPDLHSECYLSVKAPAINFDLELLKVVISHAASVGALVHFDAMAPDTADST